MNILAVEKGRPKLKNGTTSLKPLQEQIIVITGASSGISLSTARLAAKRGAKLVLAARSANALKALERENEERGYPFR